MPVELQPRDHTATDVSPTRLRWDILSQLPRVVRTGNVLVRFETKESSYRELSPLVRSTFRNAEVQSLMAPLVELASWKGDHSLDMARMTEPVYATLDRLGLPHVSAEKAVKAALLHDIGIAENPHTADDPGMVNSGRKYTPDERVKFGTHPHVGAERVSDSETASLIEAHHSYDRFKESDPQVLLSDALSVSQMVLAAMDIAHAVRDVKRPYEKWTDPNDPTEKGVPVFTDEKTREVIKIQVPALPDEVVDSIVEVGRKVLDTPVPEHFVRAT